MYEQLYFCCFRRVILINLFKGAMKAMVSRYIKPGWEYWKERKKSSNSSFKWKNCSKIESNEEKNSSLRIVNVKSLIL